MCNFLVNVAYNPSDVSSVFIEWSNIETPTERRQIQWREPEQYVQCISWRWRIVAHKVWTASKARIPSLKQSVSSEMCITVIICKIPYNRARSRKRGITIKILSNNRCLFYFLLQNLSINSRTTTLYTRSTKTVSHAARLSATDNLGGVFALF